MSLAIVIMAAGKGTRLKSARPKVLHAVGGKALLSHVIATACRFVVPEHIFVVVGHQAEKVEAEVAPSGVRFVVQKEQLGTGDAVRATEGAVAGYDEVVVLSGDVPLIRVETIEQLLATHHAEGAAMTLLAAVAENPFGYGRVIRKAEGSPEVISVIEEKSLTAAQRPLKEINTGIYAFQTAALFRHLKELSAENAQKEYYLTDMADILARAGERVVAVSTVEVNEVLGANTIAELVALDATLRARTASRLMAQGVTIYLPATCLVDESVEVGPDTIIEPNVQLLGKTVIGSNCMIRSNSVIEDSRIADGVLIRQGCVIADSVISEGAKIGPFAHVRPGSEIGEDAHVGNFVETKKARLGKGAKANHLSYLGDTDIGAGTNIGAGVITCNYDGVHKHRTVIGEGVFVGSDSTLVAPVSIGDGAYVGAGSCITRSVPEDALAVARGRQVLKENWAAAKRERLRNPS